MTSKEVVMPLLQENDDDLMAGLEGLDDSFWNAVPTPDPTPVKQKRRNLNPNPVTPSKIFSAGDVDISALLSGAEDWDWEDNLPTPRKQSPKKPTRKDEYEPEICTRCIVESISISNYNKTLTVKVDNTDQRRSVILQDDWFSTDVRPGDTINVLGPFSPPSPSPSSPSHPTIHITSKSHLLILHPDILLTATSLANAPECRRKPLLQNLVRSTSDTSPALVWGNMLHEVMQACLVQARWEEWWIEQRIREVVGRGLEELLRIDVSVEQAVKELMARAQGLVEFSKRYLSDSPKPDAILTNTRATRDASPSLLAITHVLDIEEDILSPTYGLKGKLDATVHAIISDPLPLPTSDPFLTSSSTTTTTSSHTHHKTTTGPIPFEIKTGRSIAALEHRAQTMLYTLLASERYRTPIPAGLLYYTQTAEVVRVPAARNELRGLFVARNEMVAFMVRREGRGRGSGKGGGVRDLEDGGGEEEPEPFLPPTVDNERTCGRCFALDTCMLYRKAVENITDTTTPLAPLYALKTTHLTTPHLAFFKKWEALLALEEREMVRFRRELWRVGAREREGRGRCFAGMRLDEGFCFESGGGGEGARIHRFTYRFVRASSSPSQMVGIALTPIPTPPPPPSLLNGSMAPGDPITISVEPGLLALARGFIVDLEPEAVVLGVDHVIDLDAIRGKLGPRHGEGEEGEVVFRIDKDELLSGLGRVRSNLAQLFYADGDRRRLELVVDLKPPSFSPSSPSSPSSLLSTHPHLPPKTKPKTHLNPNQQHALNHILSAQDYALILGMPGTGKTTVIVEVVRALVGMGKSVLVVSYTHSAVDTILAKLGEIPRRGGGEGEEEEEFGILRLGNVDKVHPDVKKFTLARKGKAMTIEELKEMIMIPPVVATTCLSIDHALFSRRKFDVCIVDEASQITLPTCLGPLRFADKFVLVGDHFQLPPLVKNKSALKGGLDISLFRTLSTAHPHAVVDLTHQYRMNEDIMLLSNVLIYGGRLRCGSEEVARRGLGLPFGREVLGGLHAGEGACGGTREGEGECWLEKLMDENTKAVFLDTDALPARDSRIGDLIQNPTEALLVRQITETLLRSGVQPSQIGVISLYRQQVKLLGHTFEARGRAQRQEQERGQDLGWGGIEILTADRSQGRDKDCIIISMVRSNSSGLVGDLAKDWRRVNVSFTRARCKLVVVGSRETLRRVEVLGKFFEIVEGRGWVVEVPTGGHLVHGVLLGEGEGEAVGGGVDGGGGGKDKDRNGGGGGGGGREKRGPDEMDEDMQNEQGDEGGGEERSVKRSRTTTPTRMQTQTLDAGFLRGRPILRDLVNGDS